jgi:carboxylesterase type B
VKLEWVLTTASATDTNGLTCFPKHGGARDNKLWSPILCLTIENVAKLPRSPLSALTAGPSSHCFTLLIIYISLQDSKPHGVYENLFEAYDDSIICPQFNDDNKGRVDCLRVNVYVPNIANSKNKVPVMVYFHGGAFNMGSSGKYEIAPKYLVKHNVIVVTVNYRVGAYGFMCLDIPEVPGNQGLKDQQLGLKWLKDNIGAFGGDANKVTIFGNSAGAHSIDFQLMYGENNLFNNAILQSGGVLSSTVYIEPDKQIPLKIATHLGFATDSLHEALSFLSCTDSDNVVEAVAQLGLNFKPCVEKKFDDVEPFINRNWISTATYSNLKGKTIITGFTECERITDYINPEFYEDVDVFYRHVNQLFNFNEDELTEAKNLLRYFYLGSKGINEDSQMELANFDSDMTYIHPMHRTLSRYLDNEVKNVYHYMFSYAGGRNSDQVRKNISLDFAGHSDELGYLFDSAFMTDEPSSEDQLKIDQMTTMWTNFAKSG